jgi:hypothetical protein
MAQRQHIVFVVILGVVVTAGLWAEPQSARASFSLKPTPPPTPAGESPAPPTPNLPPPTSPPAGKPSAPPTPTSPPPTEKPPVLPTPVSSPTRPLPTETPVAFPTSAPSSPTPASPPASPRRPQPTTTLQPTSEATAIAIASDSPGATATAAMTSTGNTSAIPRPSPTHPPFTPTPERQPEEDSVYLRPVRYPSPLILLAGIVGVTLVLAGVSFIVWLVVHNVRYTQQDLALKAAQVLSRSVSDDHVLELLAQYAYDATHQRLPLIDASAVGSPVPHVRATTMNGDVMVIFTPDSKGLARHLRETAPHRTRRYPLTPHDAGLLAAEKMRQTWTLLAEKGGLSASERVLPSGEWSVFLVERVPLRKKRCPRWWWR